MRELRNHTNNLVETAKAKGHRLKDNIKNKY
jgi:hypothetical protein